MAHMDRTLLDLSPSSAAALSILGAGRGAGGWMVLAN
jgi:hypothetical protein